MKREIRKKLIELARLNRPWTYSQLNDRLELGLHFQDRHDRDLVGDWLREISRHELRRKRPRLGALIIHQTKHKLRDPYFVIKKINECYAFWGDDNNYYKYKDDY